MEKLPLPSKEEIEKVLKEMYKDWPEYKELSKPFMTNYRWTDEEGNHYSSWDISSGGFHVHTGDGGAEIIVKMLKEKGFTLPDHIKDLENT